MTPKRVTSGGARLRGLASGQLSSKETLQRWRVFGDTVFNLTDPGIEPKTSRLIALSLTTELTDWLRELWSWFTLLRAFLVESQSIFHSSGKQMHDFRFLKSSSIQFQSGFLLVPESGRIHLIPLRSLSHLPSISFDLQLPQSSTRLSSYSLPPSSSMSVLAVLAFASHLLPSSLPSSVYYHHPF